ncbi:hypothetical protein CMK19_09075 [Candidatus Poribacteria bacterium]|nr:hypothetical protein [Candidatus Poribacteria bacterium]
MIGQKANVNRIVISKGVTFSYQMEIKKCCRKNKKSQNIPIKLERKKKIFTAKRSLILSRMGSFYIWVYFGERQVT